MPKGPILAIWAYAHMPKLIMNMGLMGIYQDSTKILAIWLKLDLIWPFGLGFIEHFGILEFMPL